MKPGKPERSQTSQKSQTRHTRQDRLCPYIRLRCCHHAVSLARSHRIPQEPRETQRTPPLERLLNVGSLDSVAASVVPLVLPPLDRIRGTSLAFIDPSIRGLQGPSRASPRVSKGLQKGIEIGNLWAIPAVLHQGKPWIRPRSSTGELVQVWSRGRRKGLERFVISRSSGLILFLSVLVLRPHRPMFMILFDYASLF